MYLYFWDLCLAWAMRALPNFQEAIINLLVKIKFLLILTYTAWVEEALE